MCLTVSGWLQSSCIWALISVRWESAAPRTGELVCNCRLVISLLNSLLLTDRLGQDYDQAYAGSSGFGLGGGLGEW